jgi:D-alanyl-D-alanine carboxypeptidase (penicillin-binding protein 5/6)
MDKLKLFKYLLLSAFLIEPLSIVNDANLYGASKVKKKKALKAKKANASKKKEDKKEESPKVVSKEGISAPYALLIEDETNTVLYENQADVTMDPASMTKMLTAYVVMDQLKSGLIKQDTLFTVSKNAYRKEGSTSFLQIDSKVSVIDLLKGLIVQSGNDAAVTLAEGIAGTEEAFSEVMNKKAKELGMANTHFVNASGLPHADHKTTARDLIKLGQRLREDFPEFYPLWADTSFEHSGVNQQNRNPLLEDKDLGCDGIKTGSSTISGFGITATCSKDGRRLYAVVNGLKDKAERAQEIRNVMNYGFNLFDTYHLFERMHAIDEVPVWYGSKNAVSIGFLRAAAITHKKFDPKEIKVEFVYEESLKAPIKKGDVVGKMAVKIPDAKDPIEFPIVCLETIEESGVFKKAYDALIHLFGGRSYNAKKKNITPIVHRADVKPTA